MKKSKLLANTLVLFLVAVIAVFALAMVNQVTRDSIAQAEIDARNASYRNVYADAYDFKELDNEAELIEASQAVLEQAGIEGCVINNAMAVVDESGNVEGYVVSSSSMRGYGGEVQFAVGIKDGRLTGLEVVKNSETPGFGANCKKNGFEAQFAGKLADTLSFIKEGEADDTQFDAISGATITSTAVQDAVNAATEFYNSCLAEKGE